MGVPFVAVDFLSIVDGGGVLVTVLIGFEGALLLDDPETVAGDAKEEGATF